MKGITKLILMLAAIASIAQIVNAQVTGGAVTGTVNDANGAIVQNVTVKLTNKAKGNSFTTQSTDSGSYTFPNVPVGEYSIAVEHTGYSTVSRDLTVALNQTTTADIQLQPAGVTGEVNVSATADILVQVDSSQVGKSFDTRKVQDLPILGDQNALSLLAPNVTIISEGTSGSGGTVGGVRPRGNTFNIDGVDNNDPSVTGPSTGVIQDAIEEFTLLQNNYNAEFGAGAGGQFNTITKSGTNQFRGSAFMYVDSQRFNARTTLEDGLTKNFFKQTRYGGTFGGPILKNKLFFFGAFERGFSDQATTPGVFFAPTAEGLDQIAALPGASPFVVNLLRENLTLAPNADFQSGITRDEEGQIVIPTVLGVSGIPFGRVLLPVPASSSTHAFQTNVDYIPDEKNQFRFRFSYARQRAEQPGGGSLKFNNLVTFDPKLFSANWVRTISPSLVNDLRISYRTAPVGFPLKDESLSDFPNITVQGLNFNLGPNSNLPQGTPVDMGYQVYDALTFTKGVHTFKFGGEFRKLLFTSQFLPRGRGDYIYSDLDALITDAMPDTENLRGVGSDRFVGNRNQWFAFAQDDWKVRSNFTLNLGLRYEYSNLPRDAALQELNSIADVPGVIEFRRPKTDRNNFAPRIGFAWAPSWDNRVGQFLFGNQGQSSIRANFAIAHFVNFQNLLLLNLPPQFQQEVEDGGSVTNFLQNGGAPNIPQPATTTDEARAATSSFIEDQVTPYSVAFNLSYQRELTRDTGIEFRYLYTNVRKLPIQVRYNAARVNDADLIIPTFFTAPTPDQLASLPTIGSIMFGSPTALVGDLEQYGFAGTVTSFPNIGESVYHGGSVSATRRFTKGLGFTAAYTFSKLIDNGTNELFSSLLNPRRAETWFNIDNERGLSALDVPHRFVASFNYDIPFFENHTNPVAKAVLSGWSINGIFQAQSGQPITVQSGLDSNLDLDFAGDRAIFNPNGRPGTSSAVCPIDSQGRYLIGNAQVPFAPGTPTENINECSFGFYGPFNAVGYLVLDPDAQYIQAGFGAKTNVGRNTLRTKGFNRTDVVFLKNTRFGTDGRFNLQIGAEVIDLFNQRPRTIFGVGALTGAFALAGNAGFNNYDIGAFNGRTITMRAKFIF